jgi:uncharacterized DUF497 family protein
MSRQYHSDMDAMGVNFEWDSDKAEANLSKHGLSFKEASTVFADPLSLTIADPLHSSGREERSITIGTSYQGALVIVSHCDRGENIRIISARQATRRERQTYEQ